MTQTFLPRVLARIVPMFVATCIVPFIGTLSAQTAPKHLNPVIEKLAAGKPFHGRCRLAILSLENARALARADIDYVYLEMEHGPMDFEGLHRFTVVAHDR